MNTDQNLITTSDSNWITRFIKRIFRPDEYWQERMRALHGKHEYVDESVLEWSSGRTEKIYYVKRKNHNSRTGFIGKGAIKHAVLMAEKLNSIHEAETPPKQA